MRIGICDDEKAMRKRLRQVIEIHLDLAGDAYEIVEYASGEVLLSDEEDTELLFLDIEMPGIDGMETARRLRAAGKKTIIIFVTAYPDFVFQGYEVQAFHYILKPYEERKIREVLDRAMEEAELRKERYFVIEQKSGTVRLPLSGICCFKSERRSVEAVMRDGSRQVFYGKLDEVEAGLPAFYQRVHNRYLVNMQWVSRIEGNRCICGGEEIPISRAYKQEAAVAFARMLLK